jgi:hypothetical protein
MLTRTAEASNMAKHAATLIKANGMEDRIIVVNSVGKCVAWLCFMIYEQRQHLQQE